jgi:Tol biopolymer transport system component
MSAVDADVLAFASGGGGFGNSRIFLIDRDGNNSQTLGDPLMTIGLEYSPSGDHVALAFPDRQKGTFDIWILEVDRNLQTRFTFATETETGPIWSPDGKWLAYSSDASGRNNVYRKPVSGTGSAERIFESGNDCYVTDWSPDGTMICYTEIDSSGSFKLGLFDFGTDGGPRAYRETTFNQMSGSFSPDGRWLAYMSNETGNLEVFVESIIPGTGRWRVSSAGGLHPSWAVAGDRLYYLSPGGELLATDLSQEGGGLRFGKTGTITQGVEVGNARTYSEKLSDGSLLVLKMAQNRESSMLSMITGWRGLLAERDN